MSDNIWAIGDTLMLIDSREPWFAKTDKLLLQCISKSKHTDSLKHTSINNEKFENITNLVRPNNTSNRQSLLIIFLIILLVIVISI